MFKSYLYLACIIILRGSNLIGMEHKQAQEEKSSVAEVSSVQQALKIELPVTSELYINKSS